MEMSTTVERSKPVASRARIHSQNALALSRRRIMSLEGSGLAERWKIFDNRCIYQVKETIIVIDQHYEPK